MTFSLSNHLIKTGQELHVVVLKMVTLLTISFAVILTPNVNALTVLVLVSQGLILQVQSLTIAPAN